MTTEPARLPGYHVCYIEDGAAKPTRNVKRLMLSRYNTGPMLTGIGPVPSHRHQFDGYIHPAAVTCETDLNLTPRQTRSQLRDDDCTSYQRNGGKMECYLLTLLAFSDSHSLSRIGRIIAPCHEFIRCHYTTDGTLLFNT